MVITDPRFAWGLLWCSSREQAFSRDARAEGMTVRARDLVRVHETEWLTSWTYLSASSEHVGWRICGMNGSAGWENDVGWEWGFDLVTMVPFFLFLFLFLLSSLFCISFQILNFKYPNLNQTQIKCTNKNTNMMQIYIFLIH